MLPPGQPGPHRVPSLRLARQVAVQFDQPLSSFDTSKVTNMGSMFSVRSARALPPKP